MSNPLIVRALSAIALLSLIAAEPTAPAVHVDHAGLKKLGWQQAFPAANFADLSFFEAVDALHALDVHHIELIPSQALSPEHKDVLVAHAMAQEQIDVLMAKLKAAKLDIVSYRVGELGRDEAAARRVFEFAKKIKAKNVIAEPVEGSLPMLDKLATEFGITLAVHGPINSFDGLSNRVGLCMGAAQLSSALNTQARSHVVELRLSAAEQPANAAAVAELARGGFKGVVCVECDKSSGNDAMAKAAAALNAFSENVAKAASGG
jgi:hypothetical protein